MKSLHSWLGWLVALAFIVGCASIPSVSKDVSPNELLSRAVQVQFFALSKAPESPTGYRQHNSVGSGVIVDGSVDHTLVLTADHLCAVPPDMGLEAVEYYAVRDDGRRYPGKVVVHNQTADVCVLLVTGNLERGWVPLASDNPPLGAPVVHVGAPKGMWGLGLGFVTDARYAGTAQQPGRDVTALSGVATFGCSGSGVFYRGRLIGIVTEVAGVGGYPTIAAPLTAVRSAVEQGRQFLRSN